MAPRQLDPRPLLSPGEVAALLEVPISTVLGRSKEGALRSVFTASGRRMFLKADIFALHPELEADASLSAAASDQAVPDQPRSTRVPAPGQDEAEAAAAVAEAFEIAAAAEAARAREALALVAADAAAAAVRASVAADQAKASRAFAARIAAEAVASAAEHAAAVERARAHAVAVRARSAAQQASRIVIDSFSAPHTRAEAARTAQGVATVVQAELDAQVREGEAAAAAIAHTVSEIAARLAVVVAATELAYDQARGLASDEVAATATATAVEVEAVTRRSVTDRARAARRARAAIAACSSRATT